MSVPSFAKRQKERARQDKQREKLEQRQQRRAEKSTHKPAPDGVDPDIAGIVPGPQPMAGDFDTGDAADSDTQ